MTSCLLQLLTSRGIKTSSSPALIFVMCTKSGWLITSSETELHPPIVIIIRASASRLYHPLTARQIESSVIFIMVLLAFVPAAAAESSSSSGLQADGGCRRWSESAGQRRRWVAAEAARLQPSSARLTFKPLTLHRLTLTFLTGAHCGLQAGRYVCWYFCFLLIKSSDSASIDYNTIS